MYAAYSVLIVLFFLMVSPYLVYQALRYRKYVGNLPQRLGYPAASPSISTATTRSGSTRSRSARC